MRWCCLLLSLFACGCPSAGGERICDHKALTKLSAELAAAPEREQLMMLDPGLHGACGTALPASVRSYYLPIELDERSTTLSREPDKELSALRQRACSNGGELLVAAAELPHRERGPFIYDGCNLARYGVFERDQIDGDAPTLITWGMHQWLLDQGLAPAVAKPITRALTGAEKRRYASIILLAEQVLPEATGVPLPQASRLYVSMREMVFDEERLVALDNGTVGGDDLQGHVIPRLYEVMAEEAEKARVMAELREAQWDARVLLIADRRLPFSTVIDVMYSAGRAGYREFAFVVEGASYSFSAVPIEVPVFDGKAVEGSTMTVEISRTGFTMQRSPGETRAKATAGDYESVAKFARDLVSDDPKAQRLVISAEDQVELQELLGAIGAARGPECSADGSGCVLANVVVQPDGAHRNSTAPSPR